MLRALSRFNEYGDTFKCVFRENGNKVTQLTKSKLLVALEGPQLGNSDLTGAHKFIWHAHGCCLSRFAQFYSLGAKRRGLLGFMLGTVNSPIADGSSKVDGSVD